MLGEKQGTVSIDYQHAPDLSININLRYYNEEERQAFMFIIDALRARALPGSVRASDERLTKMAL